jgi:hypothetical protein
MGMIKLEQIINEANPDRDKMYRKMAVSTFNKLIQYIKTKRLHAFKFGYVVVHNGTGLIIPLKKINPKLGDVIFTLIDMNQNTNALFVKIGNPKFKVPEHADQINLNRVIPQNYIDMVGGYLHNAREFMREYPSWDPDYVLGNIINNMKAMRVSFYHEFIHKLDSDRDKNDRGMPNTRLRGDNTKRGKKVKSDTAKSKRYVNDPKELNAHQQAIFTDLDEKIKSFKKDGSYAKDFKNMIKYIDWASNNEQEYVFIQYLKGQNRKKFLARLFQWWQRNLKDK